MAMSMVIGVVALIIGTKLFDCVSTLRIIRIPSQETNPLARRMMEKLGIKTAVWLIFAITVIIAVAAGAAYYSSGTAAASLFMVAGLFVSAIQFAVGLDNWTGRRNPITAAVYSIFIYEFVLIIGTPFIHHMMPARKKISAHRAERRIR